MSPKSPVFSVDEVTCPKGMNPDTVFSFHIRAATLSYVASSTALKQKGTLSSQPTGEQSPSSQEACVLQTAAAFSHLASIGLAHS